MRRFVLLIAVFCLLAAAQSGAQEPLQISVSVKVIEFQINLNTDTGLNAYFKHVDNPQPYGRVATHKGQLNSADLTYPLADSAATILIDKLNTGYGKFEVALQGLVTEGRATILSQPKAMVQVGSAAPTIIETTQDIPYQDTAVFSYISQKVISFRPVGVSLNVKADQVVDDDGNYATNDDTYIKLTLVASINEQGQLVSVGFDPMLGSQTIQVPEFISRSINTSVWVRHGQVLILGGLFLNKKQRDSSTLPWLSQGENVANSLVDRAAPFAMPQLPFSSSLGHMSEKGERRELVFLIKAELWRPAFTVADDLGFSENEASESEKKTPQDVITSVVGGLSEMQQDMKKKAASKGAPANAADSQGGDKAK